MEDDSYICIRRHILGHPGKSMAILNAPLSWITVYYMYVVSDLETLKVQSEAAARMGYTGKQVWGGLL